MISRKFGHCTSGGVYVPCICTHARWELSWVFRARINSLVYWTLFPGLIINRTGRLMRQNNTVSPWFNPEARVVDVTYSDSVPTSSVRRAGTVWNGEARPFVKGTDTGDKLCSRKQASLTKGGNVLAQNPSLPRPNEILVKCLSSETVDWHHRSRNASKTPRPFHSDF